MIRISSIIIVAILFSTISVEAQILKKLKKRAEKAAEQALLKKTEEKTEDMVENAFDSIANNPNRGKNNGEPGNSDEKGETNSAKYIKTDIKRQFYPTDVILTTSEDGKAGSSSYFDADELAMKGTSPDGEIMYIDSEGYNYGFNKSENKWQKTGLMKSDAMAFMMPMMSTGIIKMPVGPTMQASEQMKAKGLNANTFQLVEWAFIYRPEHFRNEDYTESTVKCQSGECVKFSSTDSEMSGTYILFDNQNRLSKVHAIVDTPEGKITGDYNFEYTDVSVNLPPAKEVKMPFQDLFMVGADATPPGENVSGSYDVNDNSSSNDSDGMSRKAISSMTENLKNSDVGKEDLPETYNFDWRYRMKMDMGNKKQEPLDMVFLLKKNANYQGVTVENPETGSISEATMVYDSNINSLVMFVISGQSKFLQIHPMQAPKDTGDISDVKIRELPPKSIIGYNSKGLEIENDKFLIQVYHSVEAPISMSNLFNFSGPMDINVPNIDPKLVEQFSKGLIMELTYTDKKKSKNNAKLTAQSLEQAPTSFDKKEYQNMSFMGQLKSMKN